MSVELIARTVKESPLFTRLASDDLQPLLEACQVRRVSAGTTLFVMGEPAHTLYIVAEGRVSLTLPLAIRGRSADVTIDEKQVGATIAWSALVPPHKLTLSAKAATDATLVCVERQTIEQIFAAHPQLRAAVMTNLCEVIGSRVSLLEALLMRDLQRWAANQS
ncbi:MAG: cyclic nucleotide-binding domain-containing protein [Deltaproteobacteria bacterium]|nr:cyclic nucleotide-binding domain-containing protein [Deltaproteobacteria bacterium]